MSRKMKLAPLTRREMLQLSGAGAAAFVCASLLPNLAAADAGLEGEVPQVNDLVKVVTAGDPDNCITYAIEDMEDYELEVPIAYKLTLVRQ